MSLIAVNKLPFQDKRKEHLRNANALVSKFKTGISNSDAEDILTIMYHKVIANVLLPQKRNSALDYLSSKKTETSESQLLEEFGKELVRISNLPMDPTYDEIKAFCKEDSILNWFEHSPHCWQDEHGFWSVRDVVGSMNNIIGLLGNNIAVNSQTMTMPKNIEFGFFPIILEQVI